MVDREFCQQFFNKPSSPETERIFARFMNSDSGGGGAGIDDTTPQKLSSETNQQNQFVTSTTMSNEAAAPGVVQQQQQQQVQQQSILNSYSSGNFYQNQSKPPLPNQSLGSSKEGSYSMGLNQFPPMRTGGVNNSNLIRHSSSPAGLFANINIEGM